MSRFDEPQAAFVHSGCTWWDILLMEDRPSVTAASAIIDTAVVVRIGKSRWQWSGFVLQLYVFAGEIGG